MNSPILSIPKLIPKLHRNPLLPPSENFLAQAVVLLARPLGAQEIRDGGGAGEESGAVAPEGCGGVGCGYCLGISFFSRGGEGVREVGEFGGGDDGQAWGGGGGGGGGAYCVFQRSWAWSGGRG